MKRRTFIEASVAGSTIAMFSRLVEATSTAETTKPLPKRSQVRVAFLLGDSANVIDTAGPWEVFQDVMLPDHHHPFELFTVAPTKDLVRMTGGLVVQPSYALDEAPEPHVIVVPAQKSDDDSLQWLRSTSTRTDVTMSVCTGAFQLGRAGLLNGLPATTHHQFWDKFAQEFPGVQLQRGLRFVDNGRIATASGLTSGIDMALHIVSRYYGSTVAKATAEYMEYSGDVWRGGRARSQAAEP